MFLAFLGSLLFLFLLERNPGNQFLLCQSFLYRMVNRPVNLIVVLKAQFHLCGMDIDIQKVLRDGKMQQSERILVLHQIGFVSLLNGT